jgi:hypothetical protein
MPLQQFYLESLSKLLQNNPEYPVHALKHFVRNDLIVPKGTQVNTKLMLLIFKAVPEKLEATIANVFHELAVEDDLRRLRELLRQICKLPGEIAFDLLEFSFALMRDPKESIPKVQLTDEWFRTIADLVCMSIILSVHPSMIESNKDRDRLLDFQVKVTTIQRAAVSWCYSVVGKYYQDHQSKLFILKKVLFQESPEIYPSSGLTEVYDKQLFQLLTNDIPLDESTLREVILLKTDGIFPLSTEQTLFIIEQLVYRATSLRIKSTAKFEVLQVSDTSLVSSILNLSIYNPLPLPELNETPLVITFFYWKACLLLVSYQDFHSPTSIVSSVLLMNI